MKNKKTTISNIFYCISYILFALGFMYLCYTIRISSWTWLDSDMSSELILAKMLNEEGSILSGGWFYGTELRILYYTQIAAALFNFTDSWYMVRVWSDIIMIVIMLISVWCLALRLGVKKYFPVMGLILVLPFSLVYYKFILYGQYYIPCIATSFFGMTLILHYKQASERKMKIIIFSGSVLLAFVSSLIGYRQVVMFYLPAFMSAAIMFGSEVYGDKTPYKQAGAFEVFKISLADIIGAGAGCLVNSLILIRKYSVEDWNDLNITNFSLDRFIETLNGIIRNLGYREERIGLGTLISNGYSFILFLVFIAAVYKAFKQRKDVSCAYFFCTVYSACSVALLCLLYALSDLGYSDRYSAPITVFVIPSVVLFIAELKITDGIKPILGIIMACLACLVSVHIYSDIRNDDQTMEQREIAAFLTDNGYYTGYGTYWNANVFTELSNGAIDMYDWHNEVMFPTVESVNSVWHWLQKTSHETTRPEGKVFHIYDEEDKYNCNWKAGLSDDDIIYTTSNFIVYGYPSYDEMLSKISSRDLDLTQASIDSGSVENNTALIQPQGVLTGQNMLFYGGACKIRISGENLSEVDLKVLHYVKELDHSEEYEIRSIEQNENEITAVISVPEDTGRSRIKLTNGSDRDCKVNGIHIEWTKP